jgi:TP901 family phage tail tape measure protein
MPANKFALEGVLRLNGRPFMRGLNKASRHAGNFSRKLAGIGFRGFTMGATAAGIAATAFGVSAARTIAGYGEELAKVKALTGATDDEFAALDQKARKMGATTAFSAQEAAAGMAFLAQAGFKVNDILDSSESLLNLAAAGGLDLATAMDIASNIMTPFSMKAEESARMADVLAKTASSSNTNVLQLGEAFKKVAPVSANLGISFEETAAAIGVLGNSGIQASDAGTALRTMLSRLVKPSSEVTQGLDSLGLKMEDVNPATHSLTEILDTLAEAQQRVNDRTVIAAANVGLFGLRAQAAGGVLIKTKDNVKSLHGELLRATGASREMSRVMLDSLAGDAKIFVSAFKEMQLAIGEAGLTSVLREATQWATHFVRAFTAGDGVDGIGKAIRNAFDAVKGAFADVEKFQKAFSLSLKLAGTELLNLIIVTVQKLVKTIAQFFKDNTGKAVDSIKLAATFFGKYLMLKINEAGDNLLSIARIAIAMLIAGLDTGFNSILKKLATNAPKLAEWMGIRKDIFGKTILPEANFAESLKKWNDTLQSKGMTNEAGVEKARKEYQEAAVKFYLKHKNMFDGFAEYFSGLWDGSTVKRTRDEFLKAVSELIQAGKQVTLPAIKAQAAKSAGGTKTMQQAASEQTDVEKFREHAAKRSLSSSLFRPAQMTRFGSDDPQAEIHTKTGGIRSMGMKARARLKQAIEERTKKDDELKEQNKYIIEGNTILLEQTEILRGAFVEG